MFVFPFMIAVTILFSGHKTVPLNTVEQQPADDPPPVYPVTTTTGTQTEPRQPMSITGYQILRFCLLCGLLLFVFWLIPSTFYAVIIIGMWQGKELDPQQLSIWQVICIVI